MGSEESSLAVMSRAEEMLARASTIAEVRELKNLALTAAAWAQRKKLGEDAIRHCQKYALLAERKLGEMLAASKDHMASGTRGMGRPRIGGQPGGPPKSDDAPTLRALGISKNESAEAQKLAKLPEPAFRRLVEGKTSKKKIVKELRHEERQRRQREIPKDLPAATDRYRLLRCDLAKAAVKDNSVDAIITDPPYPEEFLPVYDKLGAFAARVLRPGGSLVCMVGQSYLPEILTALGGHAINYQWTLSYLTPGGQAVQLWQRKVNTFWKPLLWYVI